MTKIENNIKPLKINSNSQICAVQEKAKKCLINKSTFDNGCSFDDIRSEINDHLIAWSHDISFKSCGFKHEDIDKIMPNDSFFSASLILFSIFFCFFIIVLFIFVIVEIKKKNSTDTDHV
jgi:hypothetical protein